MPCAWAVACVAVDGVAAVTVAAVEVGHLITSQPARRAQQAKPSVCLEACDRSPRRRAGGGTLNRPEEGP
jgi:hypothetical protein